MLEALEKLKELGFTVLEARLMGLSKARRKDGDWFRLEIQVSPDDMPNELYKVPLGTRLSVAMVELADDEQPVEKPKRVFEDLPPSQQAGIRCKDIAFQGWCINRAQKAGFTWDEQFVPAEDFASDWVHQICRVSSRRDLDTLPGAAERWKEMLAHYEEDTHLPDRR